MVSPQPFREGAVVPLCICYLAMPDEKALTLGADPASSEGSREALSAEKTEHPLLTIMCPQASSFCAAFSAWEKRHCL